jgi:D-beta-D-heptose 7-phosphate kinase/D-beta-D-heptose 1-phosphate adenosyltransferase
MNSKIKPLREVLRLRRRLEKAKKKVVFTNGCFDILHFGHVAYLRKAKREGDFLIVGLNSDASVRRLKGPGRPVNRLRDRAEVLSELRSVDCVTVFGQETPLRLIGAIKPDVLVKGADWVLDKIAGRGVVEAYGGVVKRVPLVPGRSTSATLRKLASGTRAGRR